MNIAEIAERLKAYEELDRQIKHEKLRILEAAKEKSRTETKSSPTIRYPSGSNHSDRISRQLENASRIYAETSSFLDGYRRVLADSDASVKQVRVQIKMHINKKVGQVCNSLRQMVSIINNSLAAFNEAWTAKGPDMMHFAVTIMASKILDQAETEVATHSASAFPIAQVCKDIAIFQHRFLPILLRLMYDRCPLCIPALVTPDGKAVDFDVASLNDRDKVTGLITLLAAIYSCKVLRVDQKDPFPISAAMEWIEASMELDPTPLSMIALACFLEICSGRLLHEMKQPFIKLMIHLQNHYLPRSPPGTEFVRTRLEIVIESVRTGTGQLMQPFKYNQ